MAIKTKSGDHKNVPRSCYTYEELLDVCRAIVNNCEHGDLAAAARLCQEAIDAEESRVK